MLERLYHYLDQNIVAIENELGAIKSFRPFAFASIVQALKLFIVEILKSFVAILILLFENPRKSFEILRVPAPAYSFEAHTSYHKRIRFFSLYGLGSVIAAVVIISLVLNLITPASQVPSFAATFSTVWTTQGDFDSNSVTGQGATTKTNVDTAASAGDVKLSTVGTDVTFTETFTGTTNIDTANSADSASGVSGGQLQAATGTATDLSAKISGSTWMNIATDNFTRADNTDIATGSSIAWIERAGDWDILSNRVNLNTASVVAVARTGTIPVADYTVQAVVNSATTAAQEGVVGRRVNYDVSDSNGYFLHIQPGTGLNLQKRVSGVWTSLGSFAATINTGTDYTIKLKMESSTITGFLDGVQRISVTDASLTAAGDAGVKAESVGFKADNFTVDFITSPDVKSMARASNGDIYVGGDNARFGKYTPGTDTFTDLSSKISFLGNTRSVFALTFDSTNNVVYLGGNTTRFAKCTTASPCDGANGNATDLTAKVSGSDIRGLTFDSANNVVYLGGPTSKFVKCTTASPCDGANGNVTDLSAKVSGIFGAFEIRGLTFDSANNVVYLGTENGKFAKCTAASPCDGANGNVTDLTAKISGFWSTNNLRALIFDSANNMVYLGGVNGKFAKCTTASPCDGANGNATDLTAKISGFFSTNNVNALTLDSTNNVVYLGGNSGKFAKCTTSSACDGANGNATDLTAKISGFWSTGAINALAYDSTSGMIYLGGLSGRFAKFTALGTTQSAQSIAVDTLATNITYATLTKNDTPGTAITQIGSDVTTGTNPRGVAYDATQNAVWVVNFTSNTLQKFNAATGAQIGSNITTGTGPRYVSYDATQNAVWVTNETSNTLQKFNAATGAQIGSNITTGTGPEGVAYDATQNAVWVVNFTSNTLQKFNAATGAQIGSNITTGTNPQGIAYDATQNAVWVVNFTSNTLQKFNAATGAQIGSNITTGTNPRSVAYDATQNAVWVVNETSVTLQRFNASTGAQIGTDITTGTGGSRGVVYDLTQNAVWVTNNASHTIQKFEASAITYRLSSDNGTTWNTVTPGTKYNFTTNGTALKWKITLSGNATIQDITIVYNGYNTTGTITNLKKDAGADAVWGTISWNAATPTGTSVKFRTRGATAAQGSGALASAPWSPYYTTSGATITNESSAINPTYRYFEIEMFLDSGSTGGVATPTVNDFTVTHVINAAPELTSVTASQSGTDGKVTVNFSVRDTDTNTGTTNAGRVSTSLEYCTNVPTCSTWAAATTVTGDVGLKQVCDGSGGSGGLNCALTQYTAYSITWTPATDYANQYSSAFKVRVRANDNEGAFNNGYGESAAFEFDTKAPTLGSPSIKIDGTNKNLTLSVTDDNAQTPQIQMQFAKTCGALTGSWITYATPYDATAVIGSDNPVTICGQFRDYFKNTSATVSVSTLAAPASLLLQDTTNKDISQHQMFLSWGVVASATKYHIYRSTDGFATRTEVGTITSPSAPNTNFYTDTSFSTNSAAANYWNKTYSYRVTAEDSDADESIYSATKSGIPDGTTQAEEGGGTTTIVGRKTLDVTAPTISSVNAKDITAETASITWTTDEISDSTVYYSIDKTYTNRQFINSLVSGHAVELTGLTPNQTYYFKVASSDTSGNTGSDDNKGSGYTFKTIVKDADPPKIFNISIVSSATSARVSWETDEEATSYVDYTLSTNSKYEKTGGNAEFVTKHEVILKGLTQQTEYRLRIISSDRQKNKTTSSEFAVTTISLEEEADVLSDLEDLLLREGSTGYEKLSKIIAKTAGKLPAPQILGDTPKIEVTSTTAKIRWATNIPANSLVAIAPASQYTPAAEDPYVMTTGNFDEQTLSHEVTLINLAPSTLYHYQLRSKPLFGPEGRSRDLIFSTRSLAPEIFGEGIRKISQNQATVVWSTNVQGDSLVRYTPYRRDVPNLAETKLQGAPDLVFDHEITVVGLEYGTLYAIELQSTDRLGNVITKTLKPFATSIDLEPPQISQIRTESAVVSGAREQVQTIIFWKTDEPATSQVIYQEGIAENKELERTTVEDPNLTQNHVTVITSFKPGVVYRFKVRSRDAYGNPTESSNFTILAPTQKETVFQIILKNFEDTFGWVRKLKL